MNDNVLYRNLSDIAIMSQKPTYGESEGRTATKAFRKRDLPTDQAQAQQPEWDVPQWGCSGFRNRSTAR
jgi:hypothetical protein